MLTVRCKTCLLLLVLVAGAVLDVHAARQTPLSEAQAPSPQSPSPQLPGTPDSQAADTSARPPQQPDQQPVLTPAQQLPAPRGGLTVVVLDPAHGGVDQGAHGSSGVLESDVVLSLARILRISLEAQGFRVMLTRQANENRSFDERSKLVNAQRGVIFISLHVSSVGAPGTVRVYSLPDNAGPSQASHARGELIPWEHAQERFTESSHRLAELIQIQMAQRFRGSSETPSTAAIRQLRTIAAPAVAVELSSVSVPDRKPLDQMAQGLADGVARAVAAYRLVYDAGVK